MSELVKKGSLGQILLASQIITEADLVAALAEQKRYGSRIGEALVKLGVVAQEDIDWALSNQLDLPYIRLKQEMIDPEAIALVPADLARSHNLIPLIRSGAELNIAMADPLNRAAIEAIERQTGLGVNVSVALIREIREMLDACYGAASQDSMGFSSASFSAKVLSKINADTSGARLLDYLLVFILQNRLSSLSLQPIDERVVVKGRRSGSSHEIGTLALKHYPDFVRHLRVGSALAASGELTASGSIALSVRSRTIPFQVALLQGFSGEYITLRQQVPAAVPLRLADLAAPPPQLDALAQLARAGQGITLFASRVIRERCQMMDLMLEETVTDGRNVIILGDGPGRLGKRFARIPLPESDRERARLIMDSLDHDPDILVIEDVTGAKAFGAACRAAMQGKLVLAGLGLRGSVNALQHLLLYRQQGYFLPLFVNGLVAFKGIHLLCPSCRTEYLPPPEELTAMGLEQAPPAFYRSTGCEACGHSGFSERRFLLDVLPFEDEFLRLFEQAGDVAALEAYLSGHERHGLSREGLRLLNEGQVSPEEYIAAVVM